MALTQGEAGWTGETLRSDVGSRLTHELESSRATRNKARDVRTRQTLARPSSKQISTNCCCVPFAALFVLICSRSVACGHGGLPHQSLGQTRLQGATFLASFPSPHFFASVQMKFSGAVRSRPQRHHFFGQRSGQVDNPTCEVQLKNSRGRSKKASKAG